VQRERLSQEDDTPDDRWGKVGRKLALKSRPAFLHIAERVMRLTDSAVAPWYLLEATDANYRDMTVGKTLANALLMAQQSHQRWSKEAENDFTRGGGAPNLPDSPTARLSLLDSVDLTLTTSTADYKKSFEKLRKELSVLFCETSVKLCKVV
jgi:hypothetical protein